MFNFLFSSIFYFLSSSFFSLNMHNLCPTYGYCTTIQKNQLTIYASNVGIAKCFKLIFLKFNKIWCNMLTFKTCKHDTSVRLQSQWNKTCMYWCKYHIYQNFFKSPKNRKHELYAIIYPKETQIRYICYSLT
jgi:hypothetical protein